MKADAYSTSNSIGTLHEDNQDSYFADAEAGLFVVADGVGGYRGGKRASSEAVKLVEGQKAAIRGGADVVRAMKDAQRLMLELQSQQGFSQMGTTIVIVKTLPRTARGHYRLVIGSAGDSSALLIRGGNVREINVNDSYRNRDPEDMYHITQYIGCEEGIEPHVTETDAVAGDVLLVCSDGITDNLGYRGDYRPLADAVSRAGTAKGIAEAAMRAGIKRDDMTVVIVRL